MRAANRVAIQAAIDAPPTTVLHFGQRRGLAFEAYQRRLATLLEEANCAEMPTRITETMLAAAGVWE